MMLLRYFSNWEFPDLSSPAQWRGVSGARPGHQSVMALPPLASPVWLASRYTCHLPALWRLTWRALLLAAGIAYAELNFLGDLAYTHGANGLVLNELQKASRLFPLDHYYRLGVAQLVIRDNVWYTPEQGLEILQKVREKDPYSLYLKAWVIVYQQRQQAIGVVGNPSLDYKGRTTSHLPVEND